MIRAIVAAIAFLLGAAAGAREPPGLHSALDRLAVEGRFSGAVVIRGPEGIRFARGYGLADPFANRAFTPDTPADSGSLAKPVTAAAVLMLAREGKLDLDAPVRRYLPEYPHASTIVRHLLAHSAGLSIDESERSIVGKTNEALLAEARRGEPLFEPGSGFTYCNLCSVALAILIERVSGSHYLDFARTRLLLPAGVALRPRRLSDWAGRAIGYRRTTDGKVERADSYEDERFYGAANLSVSASQLAEWGTQWWRPPLTSIRSPATTPAMISAKRSGLTWGNWYCAPGGRRCHYLGHHEGFHHMLYWDSERRVSLALVSNNTLAPALQQRLQRALVAFAEGRSAQARRELAQPLADRPVAPGRYRFPTGEAVVVRSKRKSSLAVDRREIEYPAYRMGAGIRYVPGLDAYLAGAPGGGLRWLSLHEDFRGAPSAPRR
ncbi:MAG TPA: serine hydrolase domain-containing protein [Sphingomicrobium sp.]|nr:serine hydrolase domain-containing protein [Sphingomicrobium sp.]